MLDQATLMLLTSKNINALRNSGLLSFYCISREYSGEGGGGGSDREERNRENSGILHNIYSVLQFNKRTQDAEAAKKGMEPTGRCHG